MSYIAIDLFFLALAIVLACFLRAGTLPFEVSLQNIFFNTSHPFYYVFLFWGLVVVFLNNAHHLYQTNREMFEPIEIWRVIRSVGLSALIVIVGIYLVKVEGFPRTILLLTTFFMAVFFSVWRLLKKMFVSYLVAHGYNNFNVLIIGAGKVGEALGEEIAKRPELGLKIIGYLDDTKEQACSGRFKVLGRVSDFPVIAPREFIHEVFITLHHDGETFLRILEQARRMRLAVRVVPHGFDLMQGEFTKYNIGFIPVLQYCDAQIFCKQAGKRLFDFIVAFLLLLVLSPVLIVLAIMVKKDSPGPVFYLSRRYGRGGKIFAMYKFRSMVSDADARLSTVKEQNEADGPIFKIRNDPRVTRFGRFLRKYSLDELPQILNVLKGDMSLVGPRPLPISQVEREDIRQLKRLEVRPGITGLWQIRGRSDLSFKRLVKWDIWYINNWSFWLDLNILFQTIPVVIRGKGAY